MKNMPKTIDIRAQSITINHSSDEDIHRNICANKI